MKVKTDKIKIEKTEKTHWLGDGFLLQGKISGGSLQIIKIEGHYIPTGQLVVYGYDSGEKENYLIGIHESGTLIKDVLPQYEEKLEELIKRYAEQMEEN